MTFEEYLSTDNGMHLAKRFDEYFADAAKNGAQHLTNYAMQYALVDKVWKMISNQYAEYAIENVFSNERTKWFVATNPDVIFDGIVEWSLNSANAALVLTCRYDEAKKEFCHALLWYNTKL